MRTRMVASGTVGVMLVVPLVAGALGWTVSVVETGSMDTESGYAVGDLVVTAPLGNRAVAVGDVVRVRGPRSSDSAAVQRALEVVGRADPGLVHRVVELRPGGAVLTKGDANDAADPVRARTDLAGRVVAHAPKTAGTAWSWFRSVPMQVLLAVALVLLWPPRRRRSNRTRPTKRATTPTLARVDPPLPGGGTDETDGPAPVTRRQLREAAAAGGR